MEDIPLYVSKRKNILVISGGAIRGVAALGALQYLVDNEIIIKPEIICGTSVGAILGLYIAIGYNPIDIYNILLELDFIKLIKSNIDNIFDEVCFGLNTPDPVMYIIGTMMEKKFFSKYITFKELFNKTKVKLIITGTCLNDAKLYYFSMDSYPDMQILKAIRISISMPLFFKPYKFDGKIWIDGGCIENYPIQIFTDKLQDVIGILLDDYCEEINDFQEIDKYITRVIRCLSKGTTFKKYEVFAKNTIHIFCKNETFLDFDVDTNYKNVLWNNGYETAKKFYLL